MKGFESEHICPEKLYTPASIARVFQVDEQWVKKNLIYNKECRHRKTGRVYVVLGKWLIEWAERDHELAGEFDD